MSQGYSDPSGGSEPFRKVSFLGACPRADAPAGAAPSHCSVRPRWRSSALIVAATCDATRQRVAVRLLRRTSLRSSLRQGQALRPHAGEARSARRRRRDELCRSSCKRWPTNWSGATAEYGSIEPIEGGLALVGARVGEHRNGPRDEVQCADVTLDLLAGLGVSSSRNWLRRSSSG